METASTPLDVTVRGPGEPEVIVVGGVHGDETGGVRAVRRLREADLPFERGVAFVLANPSAIEAGTRYVTSDLNRVFPGDPDGNYEQRLAAHLCEFIRDRPTLSLHGTRSEPTPFALVRSTQPHELALAGAVPVEHVVDYSGVGYGTLAECGVTLEIEVGALGTDRATRAADRQARAFLQHVDVLPGDPDDTDPALYRMVAPIPKPAGTNYEVLVPNFVRVEAGEAYARVDGRPVVPEEPVYPILLSAEGYPEIFGFEGELVAASLDAVRSGN